MEKAIVEFGITLVKYWLEVSPEEQQRRLEARINDPRKIWKLSPMDLKSYGRWFDYSRARDDMFQATDTPWAPWFLVRSDDKNARAIERYLASLGANPIQETAPREANIAEAAKARGL